MENIKKIIFDWDNSLSTRQKKVIHLNSMKNFVLHFESLPNDRMKSTVASMLVEYIAEVEALRFPYNFEQGYELAHKYLDKIGEFYSDNLGFVLLFKFPIALTIGLIGDFIIYMFGGIIKSIPFFPFLTTVMLSYYFWIVCYKAPRNKVYGIFY